MHESEVNLLFLVSCVSIMIFGKQKSKPGDGGLLFPERDGIMR